MRAQAHVGLELAHVRVLPAEGVRVVLAVVDLLPRPDGERVHRQRHGRPRAAPRPARSGGGGAARRGAARRRCRSTWRRSSRSRACPCRSSPSRRCRRAPRWSRCTRLSGAEPQSTGSSFSAWPSLPGKAPAQRTIAARRRRTSPAAPSAVLAIRGAPRQSGARRGTLRDAGSCAPSVRFLSFCARTLRQSCCHASSAAPPRHTGRWDRRCELRAGLGSRRRRRVWAAASASGGPAAPRRPDGRHLDRRGQRHGNRGERRVVHERRRRRVDHERRGRVVHERRGRVDHDRRRQHVVHERRRQHVVHERRQRVVVLHDEHVVHGQQLEHGGEQQQLERCHHLQGPCGRRDVHGALGLRRPLRRLLRVPRAESRATPTAPAPANEPFHDGAASGPPLHAGSQASPGPRARRAGPDLPRSPRARGLTRKRASAAVGREGLARWASRCRVRA